MPNGSIKFKMVQEGLVKRYYNNVKEVDFTEFQRLLTSVNHTFSNFMETGSHDSYTDSYGIVYDVVTAEYPV